MAIFIKCLKKSYVEEYLISYSDINYVVKSKTYVVDVTNSIKPFQNNYPIQILNQQSSDYSSYGAYYLVVYYENSSGNTLNCSVLLNDQDLINKTNVYNITINNSIDQIYDIGLAIHSDILWDDIQDGTEVLINGNSLGIIGGSDLCNINHIGAGVKGSFYYRFSTVGEMKYSILAAC